MNSDSESDLSSPGSPEVSFRMSQSESNTPQYRSSTPTLNNPIGMSNPNSPAPRRFLTPPGFESGSPSRSPSPLLPSNQESSNDSNPVDDTNISSLLSNLRIDQQAHSESINNLQRQIRDNEETVRDLNSLQSLHSDVVKMQLGFHEELLNCHKAVDSINQAANQRFERLERILDSVNPSHSPTRDALDVPLYPHIYFSGNPRETNQFCFFIREVLYSAAQRFGSEKEKIMWIAAHFRTEKGKPGELCPSYNWWRGLLGRNAQVLGLPPGRASSHAEYAIDQLRSAENFIAAIESTFTNHCEDEDARAALYECRQGNRTLEEFNIIFNSLLFMVQLADITKCELYECAINPRIVQLGKIRGGWSQITNIERKQELAAELAKDSEGMNMINRINNPIPHPPPPPRAEHRFESTHPPPAQPPRLSDGVPIDLDAISSELKFTFPVFRQYCLKRAICQRCGGDFDANHRNLKGCTLPTSAHMTLAQKVVMWKKWVAAEEFRDKELKDKGKKRESVLEIDTDKKGKKRAVEVPASASSAPPMPTPVPVDSSSNVASNQASSSNHTLESDSISTQPLSLADIFLQAQLEEMDLDDSFTY
ncbi:hypothetical protein PGTUg99_002846 [Puccinia graminis f. sp. tritici]|uniref:Retrotransposon gag domain-containing protein n=1 Tax=Puccinia graminis f. sp. tritici TaxID=56615 RepID=A0A5B0RQW7_PUCGR|nr:hypothetical protein PGTUg99_002846 [Puccinia graminis f. sp. tritici]